jgi:hypothetical protein
MGQYYRPIILGEDKKTIKGWWNAHRTGNGLKLMEHSYVNNSLCNCVENYIIKNEGARLVWAGDYADGERKKLTKEQAKEVWKAKVAAGEIETGFQKFWESDSKDLYAPESEDAENLYSLSGEAYADEKCEQVTREAKPELQYDVANNEHRYLVNYDKGEFLDLWNDVVRLGGCTINPLPLLTCEGNGRGGGDYSGLDEQYIGTWARDFIKILPNDYNIPNVLRGQGFKEIKPRFVEGYDLKEVLRDIAEYLPELLKQQDHYSNDAWFLADIHLALEAIKNALPEKTKAVKERINAVKERMQEKATSTV